MPGLRVLRMAAVGTLLPVKAASCGGGAWFDEAACQRVDADDNTLVGLRPASRPETDAPWDQVAIGSSTRRISRP